MKKQIMIVPIIFILLLSSSLAILNYERLDNTLPSGVITSVAEHNDNLIMSVYMFGAVPNRLYTLDENLTEISYCNISYNGLISSDDTYIYLFTGLTNPDKIFTYDTDCNQIASNNAPFSAGATIMSKYVDGEIWYGGTSQAEAKGEIIKVDTTNFLINERVLFDDFSYITHIADIGDNYYIGQANSLQQVDSNWNVIEEKTNITGIASEDFRGLTEFNGEYVMTSTELPQNKLRVLSSSAPLTTDYIFINGYYWNKYNQCENSGSLDSYVKINNAVFSNPVLQNYSDLGYSLQTLGVYGASVDDIEYCENGVCETSVTNLNGSLYVRGDCVETGVDAECYTLGAFECVTSSSYHVCGNYDSDDAPEWSDVTTCPTGEFCQSGVTGCGLYDYDLYSETIIPPVWYPKRISADNQITTYTETSPQQTAEKWLYALYTIKYKSSLLSQIAPNVALDTVFSNTLVTGLGINSEASQSSYTFKIVTPDVDANTTTYASVNCDYKENKIISNEEVIEIENDFEITNQTYLNYQIVSAINYDDTHISLTFNPVKDWNPPYTNDDTGINIHIGNLNPVLNLGIEITRDDNYIEIFHDGVLVISDQTPLSQELEAISLDCYLELETELYSCVYKFIRETPNTYYTTPAPFPADTNPASTGVVLEVGDKLYLYNYYISSTSSKEGFKPNTDNSIYTCTYTDDENCKNVRTYYSYLDMPFYSDYKDVFVCNNNGVDEAGVDTAEPETEFDKLDEKYNDRTKLLIVLGSMIAMYFLFLVGSKNYTDSDTIPAFMGALGGVGTLLFFASVGWLPAWFIITAFILSAGITTIIIRRNIMGA